MQRRNSRERPHVGAAIPIISGTPKLAPDELNEFRLRHQALMIAHHQHMLVKEAYDAWVSVHGKAHGIEGKFQINLNTGELLEAKAKDGD